MKFTISPNDENQCFDIRIETRDGRISAHHAKTADVLDWFRKLIVQYDAAVTITTDLVPLDTPEPRYLILSGSEDLPHNLGLQCGVCGAIGICEHSGQTAL